MILELALAAALSGAPITDSTPAPVTNCVAVADPASEQKYETIPCVVVGEDGTATVVGYEQPDRSGYLDLESPLGVYAMLCMLLVTCGMVALFIFLVWGAL